VTLAQQARSVGLGVILAFTFAVQSTSAQEVDSPEALLRLAQRSELNNGDLEAAIQLYETVLVRYPNHDSAIVEALFRIGFCYERLGQPEAVNYYQQVINRYPDQLSWVEQANYRLSMLPGGMEPTPTTTTPVLAGEFGFDIAIPSLSEDARFITYVNPMTGDLALLDRDTGEKRYLTHARGLLPGGSGEHAVTSIISPDNQTVVYTWFDRDGTCQLRVLAISTQAGRVLFSDPDYRYVQPGDWSQDGMTIVGYAVRAEDEMSVVYEFDLSGAAPRRIIELPDGPPMTIRYSPDGQLLSYDETEDRQEIWADTRILNLATGVVLQEITNPQHLYLHDWTPDGASLIYSSEAGAVPALMSVDIADGLVRGGSHELCRYSWRLIPAGFTLNGKLHYFQDQIRNPTIVDPDWVEIPAAWIKWWAILRAENELHQGIRDFGTLDDLAFSRDGSSFFSGRFEESQVYLINTISDHGSVRENRHLLNISYPATPAPCWSPNDRSLAYLSPPDLIHWFDAPERLIVRDIESGRLTSIPLSFIPCRQSICWLTNERVIIPGRDRDGNEGLYQVDIQSRSVTLRRSIPAFDLYQLAPGRDGAALWYLTSGAGQEHYSLMHLDLDSGATQEAYRSDRPLGPYALSDDGTMVAIAEQQTDDRSYSGRCQILLLMLQTGTTQTVNEVPFHSPLEIQWHDPESFALILSNYGTGCVSDDDLLSERRIISITDGSVEITPLDLEGLTAYRSNHQHTQAVIVVTPAGPHLKLWSLELPQSIQPDAPSRDR